MSHARVEEVSDSDLSDDPAEGDIDDFIEADIMRQVAPKSTSAPAAKPNPTPSSSSTTPQQPRSQPQLMHPGQMPGPQVQPKDIKDFQCLYPIYFDASRSRGEGRRVPASQAVRNPLARDIASACAHLRLSPVFEAHKTHPADWANPGRVRVPLKKIQLAGAANRGADAPDVKNKHHLYALVAEHLRRNPTTEQSEGLRRGARVAGLGGPHLEDDSQPWPRPAVPRGWKINDLLPAYSAAMTGGGVSENAFKDMMKEMQQGGGPGGMPGAGPGGMPALPPGMGGMGGMAEMMNMFGGMGGGGAGPSGGAESGGGGGGKKGKKGKK